MAMSMLRLRRVLHALEVHQEPCVRHRDQPRSSRSSSTSRECPRPLLAWVTVLASVIRTPVLRRRLSCERRGRYAEQQLLAFILSSLVVVAWGARLYPVAQVVDSLRWKPGLGQHIHATADSLASRTYGARPDCWTPAVPRDWWLRAPLSFGTPPSFAACDLI